MPLYRGCDCLQSAIHSGDDLKFDDALVTSDHILSANDDVAAKSSYVSADVEADVTCLIKSDATYRVEFAVRQAKEMEDFYLHLQFETDAESGISTAGPFTPTALDQWQNGSFDLKPKWSGDLSSAKLTITTSSSSPEYAGYGGTGDSVGGDFYLDSVEMRQTGHERAIEHVLLSPASNPFGETNADGIYVIDMQGSKIIIRNCRIYGTLVLIDPMNDSKIGDEFAVSMEPAVPHYPKLVVTGGDLEINPSGRGLVERTLGVNLNPEDAPFHPIGSDNDYDDTFSSGIKGLIFSSHKLRFKINNSIDGAVMSHRNVEIRDTFNMKYDSRYYRNPPSGFNGPEEIRLLPGSARRVTE